MFELGIEGVFGPLAKGSPDKVDPPPCPLALVPHCFLLLLEPHIGIGVQDREAESRLFEI